MMYPQPEVRAWVAKVLAGALQPEPDEEVWEWAERTLRIPGCENEEMEGELWSSALTPYVRIVHEWAKRPGKGEFWIKKSAQTGFTMSILILICWMIVHRPGNVCYAIDSMDEARKISRIRLKQWILNNGVLDELGGKEDDLSNLTYYLRGMTVYLIGAHSRGAWANKSIVLFILDEVDKHPFIEGEGTTTDLARARCKRPKNAKIIGFSTPGETGLISKEHAAGTREVLEVPCPHCGHYQELRWENFVFGTEEFRLLVGTGEGPDTNEEGDTLTKRDYDLAAVREGAYFRCTGCRGRIEEQHKLTMLGGCRPRVTNEQAEGRVRSLHIWDAYSPFVTFGEMAVDWIQSQGDETKVDFFMRNTRGEMPRRSGHELTGEDVLKLRGPYRRGRLPVVPDWVSMTVDVQAGQGGETPFLRWVKWGHRLNGDFYVIDWGKELPDLNNLLAVADREIETPEGPRVVESGLVDDGHRSRDVRRFCWENEPRFYPVKGASMGYNLRRAIDVKMDAQVHLPDGFGEIQLYLADDDGFKWQCRRYMRGGLVEEGDQETARGRLWLPEDVIEDEEFVDELVAEQPQLVTNRWGSPSWKWKTKGPNEAQDCFKYAQVLWAVTEPVIREALRVRGDGKEVADGE